MQKKQRNTQGKRGVLATKAVETFPLLFFSFFSGIPCGVIAYNYGMNCVRTWWAEQRAAGGAGQPLQAAGTKWTCPKNP